MNPRSRDSAAAVEDIGRDDQPLDICSAIFTDSDQGGILARAERFSRKVPPRLAEAFHLIIDEMLSPVMAVTGGRRTILFGTNSYLGLNFHPDCIKAATSAVQRFGTGSTASRVAGGTSHMHAELERDLSRFYNRRHAIVYSTGFMANLGVISALVRPGDAVFLDAHCHASIIDAANLSGAEVHFFRHNDAGDLNGLFLRTPIPGARVLLAVEGLYSVSGDIAALNELLLVARRHDAVTLVDEAHSFGIYGTYGRGVAEHLDAESLVDIVVGTLSKSAGVIGGFSVTGREELRDLCLRARSYLYTASLPPGVVAAASKSLHVMQTEPMWRRQLWQNTAQLRGAFEGAGIKFSGSGPIGRIPVKLHAATDIWHALMERGIYVNLLFPPSTPDGKAALRLSVSAGHSSADIAEAVAAITHVLKERHLV